jgi:rhamnosyltransferase
MKNSRILAIVVTYYPEQNLLEQNLSAFIDEVNKVLIWENTPEDKKLLYRFINHPKAEYCGDGINSISHALNYAWRYAMSNDYDYLLVMDQDSLWDDFHEYKRLTVDNPNAPKGIWGARYYGKPSSITFKEVYSVINSGTLVSIELINRIGGWNERFVIDAVDDEFCLRAKRIGVITYRLDGCLLRQKLGDTEKHTFFGRTFYLRNDPPQRLYSIFRSMILLTRMYPEATEFKNIFKIYWLKKIKWIFVLEENGLCKLWAIIRGIISGLIAKIETR